MTKIYLIRHAEAEGNLYRRIHGWYDSLITPRGYRQIDALAKRFKDVKIEALYSSDLRRTQITAGAIMCYHDLELNIDPRLKEVNMGVWEDVPWGNVYQSDPEQILYFSNDPAKWCVSGSEDFYKLQSRITEAIRDLAIRHDGQTIACVSHGMAIRSLIAGVKGINSENISQVLHGDNTSIALLNVDNGQISIEYYNDNSHLDETNSTFANQIWWKKSEKNEIDTSNLRFEPMDISKDDKLYCSCYREGWLQAHGTSQGFTQTPYLRSAQKVSKRDKNALMKSFVGDEFVGIIELDPDRMSEDSAGWVSFVYVMPEYRGQGYSKQLMSHAISYYRKIGRKYLRLHVAETNQRAQLLYKGMGFYLIERSQGNIVMLDMLEKEI